MPNAKREGEGSFISSETYLVSGVPGSGKTLCRWLVITCKGYGNSQLDTVLYYYCNSIVK